MFSDIRNIIEARRHDKDDEGGFTLIELLIVVVVLGILAAIVVFAVQNLTGESAKSACKSDGKTVETALEAQRAQAPTAASQGYETDITKLAPVYIKSVPNSAKYKMILGSKPATTPPTANPAGPLSATDFYVGTVLVSTAPPFATTSFNDLNAAVNPCNAVT